MSKFKVGDEVAIAAVVKITAIQPTKTGEVSYSTDRGFSIHERLMGEIALSAKPADRLMGREEPSACKYGCLAFNGICTVGKGSFDCVQFQCIREKCKAHRDYKEPQPAPRFKVGDRVRYRSYGKGTVKDVIFLDLGKLYVCRIAFDSGESFSLLEEYLSLTPPEYYTRSKNE